MNVCFGYKYLSGFLGVICSEFSNGILDMSICFVIKVTDLLASSRLHSSNKMELLHILVERRTQSDRC